MTATKQQKTPKPAKPDKLARLAELASRLDDDGRQALIEAVEEHLREPEFKEPRSPITLSHTPPALTPEEADAMKRCIGYLDFEEVEDLHTRFCDCHEVVDSYIVNGVDTWAKRLAVMRFLKGEAKLVEPDCDIDEVFRMLPTETQRGLVDIAQNLEASEPKPNGKVKARK